MKWVRYDDVVKILQTNNMEVYVMLNYNIDDENDYGLDPEDYEEAAFQEWWSD